MLRDIMIAIRDAISSGLRRQPGMEKIYIYIYKREKGERSKSP